MTTPDITPNTISNIPSNTPLDMSSATDTKTTPMTILVSGATGFIARALIPLLLGDGHSIIAWVRNPAGRSARWLPEEVQVVTDLARIDATTRIDGLVNLAGEPIVGKRWSPAQKQQLLNSRVQTTLALLELVARLEHKPAVLVSGSAIGYYGAHPSDVKLTEEGRVVDGFTHQLCQAWEDAARQFEHFGVRVCLIRTGIVLGRGGALQKMLLPFRLGLGGPVGDGEQWMSWIHIDDEVDAIAMMLTHPQLQGVFNLTAPGAVTNATFSRVLARVLRRPARVRMPARVLRLLLGEAAELLLEGQRVYPQRLLEAGYHFHHCHLEEALTDVLGR